MAKAGLPDQGREILNRIATRELKQKEPARAKLRRIASTLAKMDQPEDAISLARKIPRNETNESIDVRYLLGNARIFAEVGDTQFALETASMIKKNPYSKGIALREIAWRLARNGGKQRATELFKQSADLFEGNSTTPQHNVFSFWKTAAAALDARLPKLAAPLMERAARMAKHETVSPDVRAKTRRDIVRAWVWAGDLEKAAAIARIMENEVYQAIAISELAMALATRNDFKTAIELASTMRYGKEQAWLRLDLAAALTRADQPEDAADLIRLAAKAIKLRARDLQPIAHALSINTNGSLKPAFLPAEKKLAALLIRMVTK